MDVFSGFKRMHWKESPIKGLKPSEIMVMICLKKNVTEDSPGMKTSQIGKIMRVTSPTVTQLVNSLEVHGLVERHIDSRDRRAVRIKLSEKGELQMKKAYTSIMTTLNGLITYLGEAKSRELIKLLSEASAYFNKQNGLKI